MNEPRGKPEPRPGTNPGKPIREPDVKPFSAGAAPDPAPHPTPDADKAKAEREKKEAEDRVRKADAAAAVKNALGGAGHTDAKPRGGASGGMGGTTPGGGVPRDPQRPTDGH